MSARLLHDGNAMTAPVRERPLLNSKHEITMNESENNVGQSTPIVKSIALSQGLFALVDAADYEVICQHKWFAYKHRHTFYAARHTTRAKGHKQHRITMHGAIFGASPDHKDGNGLNNTRGNLRAATVSQNNANTRLRTNNTSGFKGVTWSKVTRKWQAQIKVNKRHFTLGEFADPQDAARCYDEAALKHYGEFARTNQMLGTL